MKVHLVKMQIVMSILSQDQMNKIRKKMHFKAEINSTVSEMQIVDLYNAAGPQTRFGRGGAQREAGNLHQRHISWILCSVAPADLRGERRGSVSLTPTLCRDSGGSWDALKSSATLPEDSAPEASAWHSPCRPA